MSDTLIEKMLSLPEFSVTDFKQWENFHLTTGPPSCIIKMLGIQPSAVV